MTALWRLLTPLPKLESGEVHLWSAFCPTSANDMARARQLLTPNEQERASRLATEALRRRFLQAHALLHTLLQSYLGTRHYELAYLANGKPFLAAPHQHPHLEFNMSHSGDYVAIALVRGNAVGVDVEVIRPLADLSSLIEACCTQREGAYLATQTSGARLVAFYRLWTRKEALLKMQGVGLGAKLSKVEVHEAVQGVTLVDVEFPDMAAEGIVGALAIPESAVTPTLTTFNAQWAQK